MKFTGLKSALDAWNQRALLGAGVARRRFLQSTLAVAGAIAIAIPAAPPVLAATAFDPDAVVTWSAPLVSAVPSTANRINNQTLRQIAHISIGGNRVRVKLSNRWGTGPIDIGGAQVALRASADTIVPGSSRPLTFSGSPTFSLPAGAELLSDWVDLSVPDLSDLAVDLYLPGDTGSVNTGSPLTVFNGAMQTNYFSGPGNFLGAVAFPTSSTRLAWSFLAAIDVISAGKRGAVVAFGDSITQGLRSTNDTNRRWPDVLARRLLPTARIGVANVGISGNRVAQGGGSTNPSALARMDRDVIVQTGATHVILLLGINDISGGLSAEDVIAALQQVVIRARTQQLKIFVGTLTPFGNAPDAREAIRLAVNEWIRTTPETDGVVDFDLAVRDPANPRRMLAAYDSGDTLHPNDAGYEAMGNAIDLNLFR
jgi:lysophospholipase L1-like esterase